MSPHCWQMPVQRGEATQGSVEDYQSRDHVLRNAKTQELSQCEASILSTVLHPQPLSILPIERRSCWGTGSVSQLFRAKPFLQSP